MILVCIIILVVTITLLNVLLHLLKKPIKWALKLLLHAAFGLVVLFIFNFLGGFVGLNLELNWLNALVSGVFGIPGVLVLLLLKYIL